MKTKGLDGRTYVLAGSTAKHDDTRPRSNGHLEARALLKKLFPFDMIMEEVTVNGCPSLLYLDFVIVKQRLVIEVQGIQHRQFTKWFHGTINGFLAQKKRDKMKEEWCALNNLILIRLDDNERDKWTDRINSARTLE